MFFEPVPQLKPIPTYVINLVRRPDRRKNVLNEFFGRSEFKVTVVQAVEDPFGALGLWKTLCMIINEVASENPDYILVCEDDHKFTNNYSERKLRKSIDAAQVLGADLLLGGVSWAGDSVKLTDSLFWVKSFSGLQFTIIFKKFFKQILEADLEGYDAADYKMCDLSSNILLSFPFFSTQRSYPYSDVTPLNNQKGRVKQLFNHSAKKLKKLKKVNDFYRKIRRVPLEAYNVDVHQTMIPTYIINLKTREDRKRHIENQFSGKNEFQITYVEGVVHHIGNVGLWESIRKTVALAVEKNEDLIIICEDDHEFLSHYDKGFLIENIIKAHSLGAEVLLGGIAKIETAVRVDKDLFWVDEFYCTQFTIVYKRFFQQILDASYDESVTADGKLSAIAVNKFVLFPFVSIQRDFGYSDITARESDEIRQPSSFYDTLSRMELLADRQEKLKIEN